MKSNPVLIAIIALVLSINAKAQLKIPVYTLVKGIETHARTEFPGHEEWGVTHLRNNTRMRIQPQVSQSLVLPSSQNMVMTPEELYHNRLESSLIFGKMGVCGKCPDMHFDFIATATPVTEDGVCLVNYHMVRPIVEGNPAYTQGDSVYFVADCNSQCYPITEILAFSPSEDIAVIRVDTRGNHLRAIPLGKTSETGQHINLISHPKQEYFTYSQGFVTRHVLYNYPDDPELDLMEISADFAEGSSGGPVLDDCGNLVALVRASKTLYLDKECRTPQMVRKVTIPVTSLKKILGVQ